MFLLLLLFSYKIYEAAYEYIRIFTLKHGFPCSRTEFFSCLKYLHI